jgi:hypothetical protein
VERGEGMGKKIVDARNDYGVLMTFPLKNGTNFFVLPSFLPIPRPFP